MIHEEKNVLTGDEFVIFRDLLKSQKKREIYIRNGHPYGFKLFNLSIRMKDTLI